MISLKHFLSQLHIPGESKIRNAHVQLLQWQHMRTTELGVARSNAHTAINPTSSGKESHHLTQQKDCDEIIAEVLQSNTHL